MSNSASSTLLLRGWVDQPNTRGTYDIIQTCFLTIFLCTWTCLHLNIPAANEGTWKPILRKVRWMILTILGPEFVAALAAGQRANAKRVRDQFYDLGCKQWTLRHSFYANMGGFVLQPRDSTPFPIHGLHLIYFVFDGRHSWTLDVQPMLRFRTDPRARPLPRLLNDGFPWFSAPTDALAVITIVIFYGVILAFGWSFVFPTAIERLLWRISALVVVGTTAAFVLWELAFGVFRAAYLLYLNGKRMTPRFVYYVYRAEHEKVDPVGGLPVHNREPDRAVVTGLNVLVMAPLVVVYVASRLYVTAGALASLRALPSGCFQNVQWATFIPHL
ncbi:MAG: hypothetical protein LQ350_004286 [Teloschistes chrysophthalmus]|nr:MAG: hypothetical protein LQ350_004286 [Niorma chrysophthalma]